ncbi:MAG TPA: transcription termination/antitermination protein NusG, partial [Clostridia bacterium]|nr:transcription termination/antitermination protein NusG [Clostridia bacterium]
IWYYVTQTRGVTGFVGPGGRPQPLDADEVKRMGLEIIDVADFNIKVGDNVQIVSGPLEKFVGVVESISGERQKVKVIVSMFGRQTPVELDFSQVERM